MNGFQIARGLSALAMVSDGKTREEIAQLLNFGKFTSSYSNPCMNLSMSWEITKLEIQDRKIFGRTCKNLKSQK